MTIGRLPRRPRPAPTRRADRARAPSGRAGRRSEVALSQQARRARATGAATRRSRAAASGLELGGDALEIVEALGRAGAAHPHARARERAGRRGRGRGAHRDRARGRASWVCCGCPGTITWLGRWRAASAIAASSRSAGRRAGSRARTARAKSSAARAIPRAMRLEVLRAFLRRAAQPERTIDRGAQSLAWLHAAYRSCDEAL